MLKTSLAAGLLACALAAPAFAQTAPATPPAANSAAQGASVKFMERMEASQFRGSDLMGRTVYNEQNENIGDIGDVIAGREGQIQAVIIDVGGFLGIGTSEVAVPFSSLRFEDAAAGEAATGAGTSANSAATSASGPDGSATGRSATEMATRNPSDVGGTGTAPTNNNNPANNNTTGTNATATNPAGTNTGTAANGNAQSGTPAVAADASRSSTLPQRIVLASTRQELESAPKFDDSAARPDGQSAN